MDATIAEAEGIPTPSTIAIRQSPPVDTEGSIKFRRRRRRYGRQYVTSNL